MDHNEEFLREASTMIANISVCQKVFFENLTNYEDLNVKFICTMGQGSIDSDGITFILFVKKKLSKTIK